MYLRGVFSIKMRQPLFTILRCCWCNPQARTGLFVVFSSSYFGERGMPAFLRITNFASRKDQNPDFETSSFTSGIMSTAHPRNHRRKLPNQKNSPDLKELERDKKMLKIWAYIIEKQKSCGDSSDLWKKIQSQRLAETSLFKRFWEPKYR